MTETDDEIKLEYADRKKNTKRLLKVLLDDICYQRLLVVCLLHSKQLQQFSKRQRTTSAHACIQDWIGITNY
jgi:hypothetical protein